MSGFSGTFPFIAMGVEIHAFAMADTCEVTLTANDDCWADEVVFFIDMGSGQTPRRRSPSEHASQDVSKHRGVFKGGPSILPLSFVPPAQR